MTTTLAAEQQYTGRHRRQAAARLLTYDDALAAGQALAEISAGHEDAAHAVLCAARLDALSNAELEALASQFGADAS
jgi:hypothetical protein